MTGSITYSTASGSDVGRIVEKIENSLVGEPQDLVRMACLALAIYYSNPNIDSVKIVEGVRGASEWIALFLSDIDSPTEPKDMN